MKKIIFNLFLIFAFLFIFLFIFLRYNNKENFYNTLQDNVYERYAYTYPKIRYVGDCGNCNFKDGTCKYCNYRLLDIK